MQRVLVITDDESWRDRLKKNESSCGVQLSFHGESAWKALWKRVSRTDWVVVDVKLLPPAESPAINTIHELLRRKRVVAVYDPGSLISLQDVRKSFIAGSTELAEKPYTHAEIVRFFERRLPTRGPSGGEKQWQPHPSPQPYANRSAS